LNIRVENVVILSIAIFILILPEARTTYANSSTDLNIAHHSDSPDASLHVQENKTISCNQKPSTQYPLLDAIDKLARIAAYVIGALWVYFKFLKGRTYKPRLEPKLTGRVINNGGLEFVKISIKIKNIGLSKFDIKQEGTALRLLSYDSSNPNDPWKHQQTISILKAHKWIEPGETVGEHSLIPFSKTKQIAVKAELILVSKKTMWESYIIIT